jgi:hypothetical protein
MMRLVAVIPLPAMPIDAMSGAKFGFIPYGMAHKYFYRVESLGRSPVSPTCALSSRMAPTSSSSRSGSAKQLVTIIGQKGDRNFWRLAGIASATVNSRNACMLRALEEAGIGAWEVDLRTSMP